MISKRSTPFLLTKSKMKSLVFYLKISLPPLQAHHCTLHIRHQNFKTGVSEIISQPQLVPSLYHIESTEKVISDADVTAKDTLLFKSNY